MRGLGNTEFLSDPGMVLYVDDAPFGDVVSYTTDLLAIDHFEVYRGPQATRFGKDAEAGVINIVTRQPTDQLEAEAGASEATFNTQQYRALVQGPLVKGALNLSLTGQYSTSDGFIQNTFLQSHADEREGFNGRASMRWTPNDNWDVRFTATADRFNDGIGLVSLAGNPRQTRSDFPGELDEGVNSQSLRIGGAWSGVELTSVTARRDFHLDPFKFDLDFSPLTGNTSIVKQLEVQWSEEVRVRPAVSSGEWNWLAGFFFSTTDNLLDQRVDFFVPPSGPAASDVIDSNMKSETYALFGECTRTLWEKLDVTLGLRLDDTTRKMQREHTSTFGPPAPAEAAGSFYNATPKLTLAYHVTGEGLLYGSTCLGFKPGGFSAHIDPPASPRFNTERVWASEIGVKSAWLDGKVNANLSLFYYDITDYQVEQFAPAGFNVTIAGAPSATSLGSEFELSARPVAGLQLSGFFGYTAARLDRFTDPFTGTTVHNTHPPFVADFNAGVAAQYQRHSLCGKAAYLLGSASLKKVLGGRVVQQLAWRQLRQSLQEGGIRPGETEHRDLFGCEVNAIFRPPEGVRGDELEKNRRDRLPESFPIPVLVKLQNRLLQRVKILRKQSHQACTPPRSHT